MKDLTIILLIKDRPKFFERWVDYVLIKRPNCKIIISDGGKKKASIKALSKLSSAQIKYQYKRFVYDKNYDLFNKKIFQSLKICKTKYAVLCADDDFFICSALINAVDFLNRNKKYICYGSSIITFGASNKYDLIKSAPTNFNVMYKNYKKNCTSQLPDKRVFFFLENPVFVIFHYVFRRQVLLSIYRQVLRSKLIIPNMVDLYSNTLAYSSGLIKTGSEVMRMKQYHSSSDAKSRDVNVTLSDKKFLKEIKNYIKRVTSSIGFKRVRDIYFFKINLKKKLNNYFFSGSIAYSEKEKNFQKYYWIIFIKNLILNKTINKFYYYFKKKYVIKNFTNLVDNMKNKKSKKEINLIFKYFEKN